MRYKWEFLACDLLIFSYLNTHSHTSHTYDNDQKKDEKCHLLLTVMQSINFPFNFYVYLCDVFFTFAPHSHHIDRTMKGVLSDEDVVMRITQTQTHTHNIRFRFQLSSVLLSLSFCVFVCAVQQVEAIQNICIFQRIIYKLIYKIFTSTLTIWTYPHAKCASHFMNVK